MNPLEDSALQNIEQFGYHILHVAENYDHPDYSYSIGIERTIGQPELVVTGLGKDPAISIINAYYARAKGGELFLPNHHYSGFMEGLEVMLMTVDRINYPEYFGWGLWLYKEDSFRVLQLVYPSTSGTWPWDPNPPRGYTWSLHKLYME